MTVRPNARAHETVTRYVMLPGMKQRMLNP
jgi:hypothetical protein